MEHLVEIFHEIGRVMRGDGVIWVNMGDSYAGSWGNYGAREGNQRSRIAERWHRPAYEDDRGGWNGLPPTANIPNRKPLDLCNIPHRLAEVLRADGWYWRSTIIWAKLNPMPESVRGWYYERHQVVEGGDPHSSEYSGGLSDMQFHKRGEVAGSLLIDCPGCDKCRDNDGYVLRKGSWRPTTSHEYIFMMCRSGDYYADGEAVREGYTEGTLERYGKVLGYHGKDGGTSQGRMKMKGNGVKAFETGYITGSGRNLRSVWTIPSQSSTWEYCSGCGTLFEGKERSKIIKVRAPTTEDVGEEEVDGGLFGEITVRKGKTEKVSFCPVCYRWDSWEAHFAAFSSELPRRCLKASTSEASCCPKCGAPWARVVDYKANYEKREPAHQPGNAPTKVDSTGWKPPMCNHLGFRPTCTCGEAESVPMRVLDPFVGSGTTGIVAKKLGLEFVGVDIKPVYCDISEKRIEKAVGLTRQLKLFDR